MQESQPQIIGIIIFFVIAILVLATRIRNYRVEQPFRAGRVWIVPAILLVMAIGAISAQPPQMLDLSWLVLSLILGLAVGWKRGQLMPLRYDSTDGRLKQRTSMAGVVFIVAILVARIAIGETMVWGNIRPAFLSQIFVTFGLGLFTATRIEMLVRGRRIAKSFLPNRN